MHKYSYIWKPLSPLSVCLSTHNTICLCIAVYFYVYLCHSVILCACSVFSVNLSWGDTCKRSRNTVILVDGNDRAVSFCGQTDSRSSTRAVRLMNEIPLQASQCQKTGDPFVRVCVSGSVRVCRHVHVCMWPTARYNHKLLTKGVSGPGKPQGRDASWESPWLKLYRLLSHTLSKRNQRKWENGFPFFQAFFLYQ